MLVASRSRCRQYRLTVPAPGKRLDSNGQQRLNQRPETLASGLGESPKLAP